MNDPRPPPEDLHSALERAVAPPPPEVDGVARAVAAFAAAVAGPEEAAPVRDYRPDEVAIILGVCAALMLAFASESLMTWVQRMELGPVQSGWFAALGPVDAAMDKVGLTAPRRWLVRSGEELGQALGTGEDLLLAGGWDTQPQMDALRLELSRSLREELEPPAAEPSAADPNEPNPASAAPPVPPAIVEPEPTLAPEAPIGGRRTTVLLMGDSMIAGSLGASLARAMNRDRRLQVVQAFQTATGLSRPDVYDWMKVLPSLLERERPALIVCSLGANDPTRIRDGDRDLEFADPGWRAAYSARVLAVMRAMSQTGARVLWLGLPPMRQGKFDTHARYLNGIFSQAARKVEGIEFLELRMLVSDPSGDYATFVRGPDGRLVRYRLEDGIHYSPAGARAITRWVVDWIHERSRKLPR